MHTYAKNYENTFPPQIIAESSSRLFRLLDKEKSLAYEITAVIDKTQCAVWHIKVLYLNISQNQKSLEFKQHCAKTYIYERPFDRQ